YANGNFYIQKSNDIGHSITFDENKDTSSYATNSSKEYANNFSGGLYFNVDYAMDSMNTFSLWMGGYGNEYQYHLVSEDFRQEFIYNPGKYQYNTDQTGKTGNYGGYGGIWYEHKFNNEGHNIMADIGFNFWGQNGEGKFVRTYQNENSINKNKKTSLSSHSYYLNTSIEYVLPYYKDGELSIGVSGNFNNDKAVSHNDTLLFGTTETYISDQLRYLNSAEYNGGFDTYVTIQQKFGNFTLKGGLRTEYIHFNYQIYNSLTDNVNRGYWGLFPSLHLSYRTKSMHNFKLSYTRRVSNPSATQLTPFITYDEDTYSTGNPELLPTYTNSVEAGWNKYFDKFGSVGLSAYFKNSRDEINSLTDVIYSDVFGRMVSFSMPVNSGKSYRTGVDLNVTYRLKSFMNIRFYSNIYYAHSETVFREEDKVMTHNLAYSFRLNFWAKLWKVLEINASANYHSKTKNLFMETKPTYSINCGLRADFLNRKISVYLNVNDIFNWNKRVSNIDNPYYISYSSVKYNSRSISAGITFRFGKIELESQAKTEGRGTGESIGG
ncbi:MAG: outer membrane beta-barrel family protein, partial [Bacteroidales bacterium]